MNRSHQSTRQFVIAGILWNSLIEHTLVQYVSTKFKNNLIHKDKGFALKISLLIKFYGELIFSVGYSQLHIMFMDVSNVTLLHAICCEFGSLL